MRKFVCSVCGYTYDETAGIPDRGIAPGTRWEELPEDFVCPLCGASKTEFSEQGAAASPNNLTSAPVVPAQHMELTPLEMSALCSNLARGCEKQYKSEEAALFTKLAQYFKETAPKEEAPDFSPLLARIEKDLGETLPAANAAAGAAADRGALRALVWSEKVTRILKSLLTRFEREGEAMLENTGVYVCTICGFIYVGDAPPELCPVCKVAGWKFEKIEEGVR